MRTIHACFVGFSLFALVSFAPADIAPQAALVLDKVQYRRGEPIVATFANGIGSASDRIALRPVVRPWTQNFQASLYVGGAETAGAAVANGSVTFTVAHSQIPDAGLANGRYVAYYLTGTRNEYQAGPVAFTIGTCAPIHVRVASIVCDTLPCATGETCSAWVQILESCGYPAVGYAVRGVFAGAQQEVASATTDVDGYAWLRGAQLWPDPAFSFCIEAVNGRVPYNAAANAVTCQAFSPQPAQTFYVAPTGSDSAPGTIEQPLATLTGAQTAIATALAQGERGHIHVRLRAGAYALSQPLVFGATTSAAAGQQIVFEPYGNEEVLLSGGRVISGWHKAGTVAAGAVWSVTVPEVAAGQWWFRDLYMNNTRLVRARLPNSGYTTIRDINTAKTEMSIGAALPATDLGLERSEIVTLHPWAMGREQIVASNAIGLRTATRLGSDHSYIQTLAGDYAWIENGRALLDATGEWTLDPRTGQLDVLLESGENANMEDFVAPLADRLLIVEGTAAAQPVRGLRFRRLLFAHTRHDLPAEGVSDVQAGHYNDFTIAQYQAGRVLPSAVECTNAVDVQFAGCRLAHTGAGGIAFGSGCARNVVDGCELFDLGGTGLAVGWEGRGAMAMATDWDDVAKTPRDHLLRHNRVYRAGQTYGGCVGIWTGFTQRVRIEHNEVFDCPYTGISVGWRWTHQLTGAAELTVANNRIYRAMQVLTDGGAIYALGTQPSSRMTGNVVSDLTPHPIPRGMYANGLYYDQGTDHWYVDDNVVYNAPLKTVHFNVWAGDSSTTSCDQLWGYNNYFDRNLSSLEGHTCPMHAIFFDPLAPPPAVGPLLDQAGPGAAYACLRETSPLLHPFLARSRRGELMGVR